MSNKRQKREEPEKKEKEKEKETFSAEELEKLLEKDDKVQVAASDIDGVLRGKVMKKSKFLSAVKDGFGFCSVVFGWDIQDKLYDNSKLVNPDTGFRDFVAKIDVSTFRRVPWNNNLPFFVFDFYNEDGSVLSACPRNLLKTVIKDLAKEGLVPTSSVEFEFFNYDETPHSIEGKSYTNPKNLTPGMFGYSILRPSLHKEYFDELFALGKQFGIPIEGIHTETGPGVYEVAIEYSESLQAADRGQLFKTAAKEIGMKHGIMPSFMAKPNPNLPGCSGHTHYSLWDKDMKKNLFYDEKDPNKMSELMKHFVAGLLHCLPYITPMLAPNINSFKRLVEGAWAPVVVSWGVENRTSAMRVINASEKAIRVENRLGGADINCYLAKAASLAAGLYGIRNKLELPPPTSGDNIKDTKLSKLPTNLLEATKLMASKDSVARKLFGDDFVDHFTATREWEWRQFQRTVTDWEYRRYFELI